MDKDKDIVVINKSTTVINTPNKTEKPTSKIENAVIECIAICFWIYAIIKLFIIDLDVLVITRIAPQYFWLLDYKFFFLIGLFAILWLIAGNKNFIVWALYITFYPLIILFWKFPKFVLKQKSWVFAIAVINAVIYFIKSIKYLFITGALFLISAVVVLNSFNKILIWLAIIVTLVILILTLAHEIFSVFKPSNVFPIYTKIFAWVRNNGSQSLFTLDENIKMLPVDSLNEQQCQERIKNLQFSVLFNRICLFGAKMLNDYQKSGIGFVSYLLTILILIIYSVISFSIINYGLFKIDTNLYSMSIKPGFFNFFYYSFNTILFSSNPEIKAVMPLSQIALMIERFVSFIIITILLSSLFTYQSKKTENEISKVISEMEREGEAMESFIQDEYKINNISEAITELERVKAGMVSIVYWLSKK